MGNPELVVSALALVLATASFWYSHRREVASIRPILIFLYDNDRGWHLRNVGGGPALNVVIAEGETRSLWRDPVRFPPIDSGDFFPLYWLDANVPVLAADYEDFQGRRYSSVCEEDLTALSSGWQLPPGKRVLRHWEVAKTAKSVRDD